MAVEERTKELARAFSTTEPVDECDSFGPTGRVLVENDEFRAAQLIVALWLLENE